MILLVALEVNIGLSEAAIAELSRQPLEYVEGTFTFRGHEYGPVGVRLKGSSTYQWLDGRPAWKLGLTSTTPACGWRVSGASPSTATTGTAR